MKKMKQILILALMCSSLCGWAMGATTSSITQHGITWKFEEAYEYGQFLNGDYWVVGDINIIHIDPCCSSTETERTRNGSMFDPNAGEGGYNLAYSKHGFDSAIIGYMAELNKALPNDANITGDNPLLVPAGTSLVSCKSGTSSPYTVVDYAILTVLPEAPEPDSFRPAFSSASKTIDYSIADVNFDALADLAESPGAPSWSDIDNGVGMSGFKYPYIGISSNSGGVYLIGSHHSVHDDFAEDAYNVWLKLNCRHSDANKKDALIDMVQLGIDLYGIVTRNKGGRDQFRNMGAFNIGKKMPILAAFKVLGDQTVLADMKAKSGDYMHSLVSTGTWPVAGVPSDGYHFAGDDITFYLTSWDRAGPPFEVYIYYGMLTDSGTVSVKNGSRYVNGNGTNFLAGRRVGFVPWADTSSCTEYTKGSWFIVDHDSEVSDVYGRPYDIADFNSGTLITLRRPYEGATGSGKTFKIAASIVYGHGSSPVSNYPNCYRGRDFNEPPASELNWPQLCLGYLGGEENKPNARNLDNRIASDTASGYYVNNARCMGGGVLVALIMGMKTTWNHNALFDFADWYVTNAEANGCEDIQGTFAENMWDIHRDSYGPLYEGPGM